MDNNLLKEISGFIDNLSSLPNIQTLGSYDLFHQAQIYSSNTKYKSLSFISNVKNLCPSMTVYLGSAKVESDISTQKKRDIIKAAPSTISAANKYLSKVPVIHSKHTLGSSDFEQNCSLYVSGSNKSSVHLLEMANRMLFEGNMENSSDLSVIVIPEWSEKERQILVFPEIGVTYILGSDYFGEVKNSFLRMAIWKAKQAGMLGLHASTKLMRSKTLCGKLKNVGMVIFGITSTGKTTHACHDNGLNAEGEWVKVVQDDVVFWKEDGSALGSERGFYIKTDTLSPDIQPVLYAAALSEGAVLENVLVDYTGNINFESRELSSNAHAVVSREDMREFVADNINLPPISELDSLIMLFMTRSNTVVPIAAKLNPEQAASAFMLSESIDASGGDQNRSDNSTKGINTNPFIIGSPADDINRFYNLLKLHQDKIEFYMLNTGGVGEIIDQNLDGTRKVRQKASRVSIPEMAAIIRGIARGTISWKEDDNWMLQTPEYVEGMDICKFSLESHYPQSKIDPIIAQIRLDRAAYSEQFSNLDIAIKKAIEF